MSRAGPVVGVRSGLGGEEPPDQERLRTALAERYAVNAVLGEGGMAIVYRATDLKHDRAVALKVLRPELSQAIGADRFVREIEIIARLQHPNILPLYDSGEADGLLYYAMPLVEGESLRDRLTREKQLPLDEAVRITRDVAGALAYAHERGIVHRDIKPENILLVGGSEPVVADFGVARALGAASGERLTRTGVGIGTPGYMSPEQVGGESNVDGRSDVYSLGCLLYEMIAGQPPFTGPTLESVVLQHLAAPIPRVTVIRPTVSPAVDRAIERALAKVPADRFATVNQFADALIGPAPAEPQRATASRIRRRSIVAGAALVLAVALIVLLQGQRQPTTDASVIAVLPFRVSGDSSVVFLREGMVDLLTTQLGSMEGQRPVDSRTVLAAWHRTVPTGNDPTTREARELAASMGSGRLILGEIVGTSAHLSISARILDVAGERQTEGAVQGPRDSLFTLVDRLTSQLVAGTAGEPGRRLADLTSTSLPALRAYLDGRAAFRRGELARARERYTNALELDSTFALAALGMASAGIWSQQAGQSAALRRGLLTGYALRDRLPLRDQLLFEAYVLPNTGAAHSAGEQLTAARRAAETAPDSPEAQYEYADRLYHSGVLLGIVDAQARAESAFARAVSLDSTFAPALAHLVEIAARSGDLRKTRRLAALYSAKASAADAGDYVRWRVALALGDNRTLADLRARRTGMDQTALNRIIGFGQTDGTALADVDAAAAELWRRVDINTAAIGNVPPAKTLHNWARNRGRSADAARAVESLQASGPTLPGSFMVYFSADQVPVLAALFWDGDSAAAAHAAARIEQRIAGIRPRQSRARALYYTDLCVAALWRLANGRAAEVSGMIERLRAGASMSDSSAVYGTDPHLCLTMLDAQVAVSSAAPLAGALVARLDSILAAAPYVFGIDFANLVLARLYEERGDRAAALRAVRRRPYDWDTGPHYLTTFLREEGRLAALAGDTVGAVRAWRQFLALRARPDNVLQAQTDSLRRVLARLEKVR